MRLAAPRKHGAQTPRRVHLVEDELDELDVFGLAQLGLGQDGAQLFFCGRAVERRLGGGVAV